MPIMARDPVDPERRKRTRMYEQWIACIMDEGTDLSEWEENFVADIEERLHNGGALSIKQAEILERIYTEKT